MISLAGGNPDLSVLPLEYVGALASTAITTQGDQVLQYGASAGLDELRAIVRELAAGQGISCTEDEILITAGSQMGLELVASLFCDPGDVVLVEAPTYVGALSVFRGCEANIQHVACDESGIIPEALEHVLAREHAAHRNVKMLYTIPNFNNQSGVLAAADRRAQILDICARERVLVIEDDPYGLLSFDGDVPSAMRSMDSNVIYLGSLSKIFSPGIRTGWVIAPQEVSARLQLLGEATAICASMLSQSLAVSYLSDSGWRETLNVAVSRYRERRDALHNALDRFCVEGMAWRRPTGGFFTWVTLPDGISSEALLQASLTQGAAFVPGTAFFADGSGDSNMRFSYSLETPERLEDGVRRVMEALSCMRNG